MPTGSFGPSTGPFGPSTGAFGPSTGAFGLPTGSFGLTTGRFGLPTGAFGLPTGAFGVPAAELGRPTDRFHASTGRLTKPLGEFESATVSLPLITNPDDKPRDWPSVNCPEPVFVSSLRRCVKNRTGGIGRPGDLAEGAGGVFGVAPSGGRWETTEATRPILRKSSGHTEARPWVAPLRGHAGKPPARFL